MVNLLFMSAHGVARRTGEHDKSDDKELIGVSLWTQIAGLVNTSLFMLMPSHRYHHMTVKEMIPVTGLILSKYRKEQFWENELIKM